MELNIKYHGELVEYFSDDSEGNIIRFKINVDDTVNSILEKFNIPQEKINFILVNGVKVKIEDCENFYFSDGDTLAVWPVNSE